MATTKATTKVTTRKGAGTPTCASLDKIIRVLEARVENLEAAVQVQEIALDSLASAYGFTRPKRKETP